MISSKIKHKDILEFETFGETSGSSVVFLDDFFQPTKRSSIRFLNDFLSENSMIHYFHTWENKEFLVQDAEALQKTLEKVESVITSVPRKTCIIARGYSAGAALFLANSLSFKLSNVILLNPILLFQRQKTKEPHMIHFTKWFFEDKDPFWDMFEAPPYLEFFNNYLDWVKNVSQMEQTMQMACANLESGYVRDPWLFARIHPEIKVYTWDRALKNDPLGNPESRKFLYFIYKKELERNTAKKD